MRLMPSFTKKGTGRCHRVGPGPKYLPPQPDDLGPEWHLTPHAERERAKANLNRLGGYVSLRRRVEFSGQDMPTEYSGVDTSPKPFRRI